MVTIEQWRAAIGSFRPITCSAMHNLVKGNDYFGAGNIMEVLHFFLMLLCNVEMSFLLIMMLMIAGDVESNPGPTYNILKIVKASYHQGNPMFGYSAGKQCLCNALFAICWNLAKKVCFWNSIDLDFILIKGDALYKILCLDRYLGPEDLPEQIKINDNEVKVSYIENVTAEIAVYNPDFMKSSFVRLKSRISGILFIVNSVSFAVLWDSKSFYIVDSHSRDEVGKLAENVTGIGPKEKDSMFPGHLPGELFFSSMRPQIHSL